MPTYEYQVRDSSGQVQSGAFNAPSMDRASRLLRRDGGTIVSLHAQEQSRQDDREMLVAHGRRVKRDDVIFFCTQLAVMVDTGVPLAEALDSIAEGTNHPTLRVVVEDLSSQVKGGCEFSRALERHPKLFSRLFVASMRVAEASGTMGSMLQRLSDYLEQDRETRKKVKGALVYPALLLSFCTVVVVALLVFVMPRFEKIYSGKGVPLPIPTQMLMGLSSALVNNWAAILFGLAVVATGAWLYFQSSGGKRLLDKVRISLPLLGPMYRKAYLARSLRTMATMVSSGVSMLDCLQLSADVAGNRYYADVWNDVAENVKEGADISCRLKEHRNLIPPTVGQMIYAGERTGQLAKVMNRVAGFCESDLRASVKSVTTLIEPLVIVIMGFLVGGIALALLLPVFNISQVVAS
ncbi:MAG: type II secretion system F family protein [Planctomycetota bacterium]